MRKSGLTVDTKVDNSSGDAHRGLRRLKRRGIGASIFLKKFRRSRGAIEFMRVGLVPARLNLGKFFLTLQELIGWFKR
jgi:hypothetical protein